jgi:hypothetical protein
MAKQISRAGEASDEVSVSRLADVWGYRNEDV